MAQPALFPRSLLTDELHRLGQSRTLAIHDGLPGGALASADFLIHVEPGPARYEIVRWPAWDEFRAWLDERRPGAPEVLGVWELPNESVARLVRLEGRER